MEKTLFTAIVMMQKALAKREKTLKCFQEDLAWAVKEMRTTYQDNSGDDIDPEDIDQNDNRKEERSTEDISPENVSEEDITEENAIEENVIDEGISEENVIKEDISEEDVIENITKEDGIDEDINEENVIKENISEEDVIKEDISEEDIIENISKEDGIDKDISEDNDIDEDISEEDVIDEDISEEDVIDEDISEEDVIDEDISEEDIIDEDISEENVIDDDISGEDIIDEDISEENISRVEKAYSIDIQEVTSDCNVSQEEISDCYESEKTSDHINIMASEIVYNSQVSDSDSFSDVIPLSYGLNALNPAACNENILVRNQDMDSSCSGSENQLLHKKKKLKKKRRKQKMNGDKIADDDGDGDDEIKKKKIDESDLEGGKVPSKVERPGKRNFIEISTDNSRHSESEKVKKKKRSQTIESSAEDEIEKRGGNNNETYEKDRKQNDPRISEEKQGPSNLNEIFLLRDRNIKGLYIKKQRMKTPKGSSKNTRVYDTTHACYFCNKVVLHINLHLKTHRNEQKVKDVLMQGGKHDFTQLRKLGDDKHNRKCIEEGHGEIILSRRPNDKVFDITRFGPCPLCREWLCLKGIKYHYRECAKHRSDAKRMKKRELIVQSQVLAGYIKMKPSSLMLKEVIPIMTNDNESKVAQEDSLITALGEGWIRRNISNPEKRKYYASARMRLCARFLIQLNKLLNSSEKNRPPDEVQCDETEDIDDTAIIDKPASCPDKDSATIGKTMWDFLKPQHFENVVLCVLKCSFPNADDLEDLAAPSNAIKLKYDIERMVNCKWAYIVKNKGDEGNREAQECQSFLNLMKVEWREKVTVLARAVLSRRKYDQVKELPTPRDVQIITQYLVDTLKATPLTHEMFKRIVVLAETRLLLYNKRRTGELEVIKLQNYASRSKGLDDFDESLAGELTAVEKKLLETQDLMKVRGKRGRPVPVLIPDDCRLPLMCLADRSVRKEAGVVDSNPYLFPNTSNAYTRAYDSLKSVCSELHLQASHQITSVSMRKYTATLTQMLNLDKNQMDWVYQHLGHTKAVHKEHYRQMSGLVERTQISKMFLIQDLNLTSKFKGKKLDEVDIKDIVFSEDQEEDIDGTSTDQFSVPKNQVSQEEILLLESGGCDEEGQSDDEDNDNDDDNEKKETTKKQKRQKWSEQEVAELKSYFQTYLQTKTTPRRADIDKIKKVISKKGGILHQRANHLIIKKISNMNHSKH